MSADVSPAPTGDGWTAAGPAAGGGRRAAGGAEPDAFLAWDATQVARDHGRPARVACLPGDPAAVPPGPVVLPAEEALRA